MGDFPGGPVVKNQPSSARDEGSIPGWGTKIPLAAGQLRPRPATTEPARSGAHAPQLERSPQTATREARVPQRRIPHVTMKIPHDANKIGRAHV